MAEINLNTKFMSELEIVEQLSCRSGTAVYIAKKMQSQQLYILKHVSIPENQKQVDALILAGAASDHEAAQAYYEQVVNDYRQELEHLRDLSASANLRSYGDYEIKAKEDGVGFDIYLLAEYRKSLEQYLAQTCVSRADAINMAIDLCTALCDLRSAGLIHRDIKPANVFLNEQGHFMLGDLGVAKIDGLKYCSMPEHMISSFSAPELFELMASVNETIDVYAVGLILYRVYNGGHAPFEDEHTSAKTADKMRITGKELPAPMFADYEIAEIIRKACAFKPEDRFQTPEEMKQAFVDYMKRNQVGDEPMIPPIVADDDPIDFNLADEPVEPVQFTNTDELDDTFKENFSPDNDMLNALIETVHKDTGKNAQSGNQEEEEKDSYAQPRKRGGFTKWFPTVLVIVLALALIGFCLWYFVFRRDTITIDSLDVTERTVSSISVKLTTAEDPGSFILVCSDPYGFREEQSYVQGEVNTFDDLAAGANYTIAVEGLDGEKIKGARSCNVSTKATTQITTLSISRQTVSEIELTFIPEGPEPNEWIVTYGAVGQEPASKSFTDHKVVLTGLEPDTEYEISLADTTDVDLTGETTIIGNTLPSVTLLPNGVLANISNSTAVITWQFEGNAPASWNVRTTGSDGYAHSATVATNELTLENLKAGETYSLVITCDNMAGSASTSFTLEAFSIAEITCEADENGDMVVSWVCEAEQEDTQWMVVYAPVGNDALSMAEQTHEQRVTLHGLIPGTTYHIEIQEATGKEVGGNNTTDLDVPPAESFTSYGFTTAYTGIYPRPAQENWTALNLSGMRKNYTSEEKIAFACEPSVKPKASDDTVTTLLVVRDSSGSVVDYYTGEASWNDMWKNTSYVGELLRTPTEPDTYSLELYFNGKRVKMVSDVVFTITQ